MQITITEQEYQELLNAKRGYEQLKTKISNSIDKIKNDELVTFLSDSELETYDLIIKLLKELLK